MNFVTNEDYYVGNIYQRFPVDLEKGKGCFLWDKSGKEYIDCMGGYGVALVGHCNNRVVEAIKKQAEMLLTCHMSLYNPSRLQFLDKLFSITPRNLNKVFFSNSGAESVEAAIKFSRKYTNKTGIAALNGAYHGKTFGALSVTYSEKYRKSFLPLLNGVKFFSYNDIEKLEEMICDAKNGIGTIIAEPIQGETGIIVPPSNFLKKLRDLCNKHNLVLIFDEIQSGLGRTGKMWAAQHWDVEPDIMCLAKGIAGGVPMGITLLRSEIINCIKVGEHSSTFAGNPLACAAGSATIESIIEDKLVENSEKIGKEFKEGLMNLKENHKIIREIRGLGMMLGVEMKFDIKDILFDSIKNGILLLYSGKNIIRLLPPLVMDEDVVKKALNLIDTLISREEKRRNV
jgi:LysW-gamma-L-lysine/LysW-L-ornithine aminotransferase